MFYSNVPCWILDQRRSSEISEMKKEKNNSFENKIIVHLFYRVHVKRAVSFTISSSARPLLEQCGLIELSTNQNG